MDFVESAYAAGLDVSTDIQDVGSLSLTVYLLRAEAGPSDVVPAPEAGEEVMWLTFDEAEDQFVPSVAGDLPIQAWIKRSPRDPARWKPVLRALGLVQLTLTSPQPNEAVIIFTRVPFPSGEGAERWLAWCFGGGSRVLSTDLAVSRFGLLTALNKKTAGDAAGSWRPIRGGGGLRSGESTEPTSSVRSLTGDVRDGFGHRMVARSNRAAPVRGLRFDVVTDLLHGVTVRTEDPHMRELHGAKSLRFSTPVSQIADFSTLGRYLVALFCRTDYEQDYAWIDNIVPVERPAEVSRLLDYLWGRIINDPDDPSVDLVVPELGPQGESEGARILFAFPGERASAGRVLSSWEHLRTWLVARATGEGGNPLTRLLRVMVDGAGEPPVRAKISQLIATEFACDGIQYVLADGDLFEVKRTFLESLQNELAEIPLSSFDFPAYTGGTEPAYLVSAAGGSIVVLDRTGIYLEGQTQFEPCDLVTSDGTLVYAKLKGRSGPFSHLCNQALVAAGLLKNSGEARGKFLELLLGAGASEQTIETVVSGLAELEAGGRTSLTVCLLVLGRWPASGGPSSLPLFSKIVLVRTYQQAVSLGFHFEFAALNLTVGHRP